MITAPMNEGLKGGDGGQWLEQASAGICRDGRILGLERKSMARKERGKVSGKKEMRETIEGGRC